MDKTSLGDRMKNNYENITRRYLVRRMPVIIRVDGRAFSSYTKGCIKPFDPNIIRTMVNSAISVANDMQGFKVAYIQSDEVSFLITDYDRISSQGWFDYNHSKLVSVSASLMTANFNQGMSFLSSCGWSRFKSALFDSRAFNIPREEVANYFLWRSQDWYRNSIQMYARSVFSHKELIHQNRQGMLDMLDKEGYDWKEDLTDQEKNGTFLIKTDDKIKEMHEVRPVYSQIASLIDPLIYPEETSDAKNNIPVELKELF